MKRLGKVIVASGVVVLAGAACFDDPTEPLRNGPAVLTTSVVSLVVEANDSAAVEGRVLDAQGNPLSIGDFSWTPGSAGIAVVEDPNPPVDNVYRRVFVKGLDVAGTVTTLQASSAGLQQTIRVVVLPADFSAGTEAVTGTASTDTAFIAGPPGTPPTPAIYTAGDTLVLTAPATYSFDPAASAVMFGINPAYILSRTATELKVMSRGPFAGRPAISNLIFAGTAETGPINIDTLYADSIAIARARFRGTTVVGNSAFGTNTQMTITAGPGTTFGATTAVQVGGTNAIVLTRNATTLTAIIAANVTNTVRVTNVTTGGVVLDSLRANNQTTIAASFFPGTVANGAGRLLDTIKVAGAGQATFTTAAATASQVTVNGQQAFIVRRTADSIYAITRAGGTSAVSISNVIVAGTTIPSLQSQAQITADEAVTGETNEPANDNPATAPVINIDATSSTVSMFLYGAGDDGTDFDDFWTFTLGAAGSVRVSLDFLGNGDGGSTDPDIDVFLCTNRCAAGADFIAVAASLNNPETFTEAGLQAGVEYTLYVNMWDTGGRTVPYRVSINRQ